MSSNTTAVSSMKTESGMSVRGRYRLHDAPHLRQRVLVCGVLQACAAEIDRLPFDVRQLAVCESSRAPLA